MKDDLELQDPLRGRPVWRGLLIIVALAANVSTWGEGPDGGASVKLAYLDPGVGSLIIQGLIAAFAAAAVAIRIYWEKVKRLLGLATSDADEDAEPTPAEDD